MFLKIGSETLKLLMFAFSKSTKMVNQIQLMRNNKHPKTDDNNVCVFMLFTQSGNIKK